jgi:hypothetical protein
MDMIPENPTLMRRQQTIRILLDKKTFFLVV